MTYISKSKNSNYAHTAKEIMERYYPDLWKKANSIVKELVKVQNMVVAMLPTCKKQLPKTFEELKEQQAQRILSDYIRLRLLFEFAEELWKLIDSQCRELARKNKYEDCYGEIDIETALRHTLDATFSFPFEEVADDSIAGFLRFTEIFLHDGFKQWLGNTQFESWRCDVMGGIRGHGLQCEWLWKYAIGDTIPTCSNIGELLPDNDMLRIY